MTNVQFDREKLLEIVRVTIDSCEPNELGKTKLHKVLYYTDMYSYLFRGVPVAGATYKKRPHGPTCDGLTFALSELEENGEISVTTENYFDYSKKVFKCKTLSKDHEASLDQDERKLLSAVIDFVCRNNTARSISEFSHDLVWEMLELGEVIPYHLALGWIPTEISEVDEIEVLNEWQELANKRPIRAAEMADRSTRNIRERLSQVH